jgi:UDP-GlcNAc:undecaprenyl-phosphate GlcNAc-1-phosphate transferase
VPVLIASLSWAGSGPLLVLAAFSAGILLAPAMIVLCRQIGWLDRPGARKRHDGEVPLAGGLLIAVSVLVALLVVRPEAVHAVHFWTGAAMVAVVGFIDDRFPLRARYRFLAQCIATLLFVLTGDVMLTRLDGVFGPFPLPLGAMAIPLTIVGIVGVTNAINLADGLDGLAAGLAAIAAGFTLVAFLMIAGDLPGSAAGPRAAASEAAEVAAIGVGAMLAFLLFNQRTPWRRRASMFLGDGGSMAIGFLVGALLVYASAAFGERGLSPVAAVWFVAVPLIDTLACMLRRVLAGTTPMTPDRRHLHHLLLELGLSPGRAVAALHVTAVALGLAGLAGWILRVPQYAMLWLLVAVFFAYFAASQRVWRRLDAAGAAR